MTPNETIQRLAHAVVELDQRATPEKTFASIHRHLRAIKWMLIANILLLVLIHAMLWRVRVLLP